MKRLLVVLAVLIAVGTLHAQDKADPRAPVPIKLQIVFEKYQGEKRLTSEPYTLSLNANDRMGRIRMGVEVPMRMDRVNDRDVPGNVIYRSVGNAVDCTATSLDPVRFKVDCTFEQSSVAPNPPNTGSFPLMPPLLRNFRTETGAILRDKQSVQFAIGTDPLSGERVLVSLTLTTAN